MMSVPLEQAELRGLVGRLLAQPWWEETEPNLGGESGGWGEAHTPAPAPDNHRTSLCLNVFDYFVCFILVESYSICPFVSDIFQLA